MADKIEIEIVFTPEGEVRLETRGLKGKACLDEISALEKALGNVTERARTSEFYQQPATTRGTTRGTTRQG
jgi:hypothetical protein